MRIDDWNTTITPYQYHCDGDGDADDDDDKTMLQNYSCAMRSARFAFSCKVHPSPSG
jgi:hypothetical protein